MNKRARYVRRDRKLKLSADRLRRKLRQGEITSTDKRGLKQVIIAYWDRAEAQFNYDEP